MFDEDVSIVLDQIGPEHGLTNAQGEIRFQVKWEGYDRPSDMTWEPEENLAYVHAFLSQKSEHY